MGWKKAPADVESVLKEHATDFQLESLVRAGCDRSQLLTALELVCLADESWKSLVEMNLRAFKGAIGQIRHCADMIDRLNRSHLIYRLSIEHRDPRFAGIHELPTLAERLRGYANLVDQQRYLFGPKRKIRWQMRKAWIVAIVIEHTGKPHDREVAALIASVLDLRKYSEKAHQAWRVKHTDFVEMMRPDVLRGQSKHPAPSNPR